MASDPQVDYDAIVEEVTATSPTSVGKMFGMPCLKTDGGKAFAGLYHGAMVFKLGAPEHAAALGLAGAQLFDPSEHGHPMKEWVVVPGAHAARWLELAQAALRYVSKAS